MKEQYETEVISRPDRQRKKERITGMAGLLIGLALIGYAVAQFVMHGDSAAIFSMAIYPLVMVGVGIALLRKSRTTHETALSQAGVAAKEANLAKAAAADAEFWNRWHMRYVAAVACFAGAWILFAGADSRRSPWVFYAFGSVLIVMGAWKAREVTGPLLGIGAIILIVQWLRTMTLSVPVAIIIGALIIGAAIQSKR